MQDGSAYTVEKGTGILNDYLNTSDWRQTAANRNHEQNALNSGRAQTAPALSGSTFNAENAKGLSPSHPLWQAAYDLVSRKQSNGQSRTVPPWAQGYGQQTAQSTAGPVPAIGSPDVLAAAAEILGRIVSAKPETMPSSSEQLNRESEPFESQSETAPQLSANSPNVGTEGKGDAGQYTQKIKWGIQDVEVRHAGKGFFGQRTQQINPRVDAYELKINPNNESYYLKSPAGGYVQYENMVNDVVMDGKLVIQQKSFYHVNDLPDFARNKVLQEAMRQVEAANNVGYTVEWLISDPKAVAQLTDFFKNKNINIVVKYFPE